jgi:hypothetical protein
MFMRFYLELGVYVEDVQSILMGGHGASRLNFCVRCSEHMRNEFPGTTVQNHNIFIITECL